MPKTNDVVDANANKPAPKSKTPAAPRKKTRYVGVFTRSIETKLGTKDIAFDIKFSVNNRTSWMRVGFQSDGLTAAAVSRMRGMIVEDILHGGDGTKPLVENGFVTPTSTFPSAQAVDFDGTIIEPQKNSDRPVTFADAWKIWHEKWGSNLARPRDEEMRFRLYINPIIGDMKLGEIKALHLETLKTNMLRDGKSKSTTLKALSDIRRVYRKMGFWDLYKGNNPMDGVVLPKEDGQRTRFLSQQEALQLLEALGKRSPKWHDIAWLSLYTGMRKGEILKLRGTDIDIPGRQILVRDAKAGSRSLPMTDDVAKFLQTRIPSNPSRLLFPSRLGGVSGPTSDAVFKRVVDDLGLNNGVEKRHRVVFHSLRHTFCSWLAMAGVPMHTIAQLAGHSTLKMTERYSHLAPDAGRAAAAKIGAMIQSAMPSKM